MPSQVERVNMRIGIRQGFSLIVVTLLLATGSSCSFTQGKGIAEAAVTQFHNQYNAGQFREIYAQTDEGFKQSASEEEFVAFLEALHRKLGTIGKTESSGWKVNATPMGTMVALGYNVEFSEGKGTEQFVFRVSDEKALLYNYNVNSPLLITK
jgi:hypothetical protein